MATQYTTWAPPVSKNAADAGKWGDMPNAAEGYAATGFEFRHVMYVPATGGGDTGSGFDGIPILIPSVNTSKKSGSFEYLIYDGDLEVDPANISIQFWQKVTSSTLVVSGNDGGVAETILIPSEPSKVETYVIDDKPTANYFSDPTKRAKYNGVYLGSDSWVADPNVKPTDFTQGKSQYGEDGGWQPWELGGGIEAALGGNTAIVKYWQGAFYNIPISSTAKILFIKPDAWQAPGIKNANYQFRFSKGFGGIDAVWETVTGNVYTAATEHGVLNIREGKPYARKEVVYSVPNLSSPSLNVEKKTGYLWLGVLGKNSYFESYSQDNGRSWKTTYSIWPTGITMPKHVLLPFVGIRASIALVGREIHFKSSRDGYRASVVVGTVKSAEDFTLIEGQSVLIITNGSGSIVFHSKDFGKTWYNPDGTLSSL